MKKTLKMISALLLAVMLVFSMFTVLAAENDIEIGSDYMSNGYIKIGVDSGSKNILRMYTTGGDPDNANDNNKLLLYGRGSGDATSLTMFKVDDSVDAYSADDFTFDANRKTIEAVKNIGGIDIVQNYTFVRSAATGRDDLVEIKYTATNNTNAAHEIGARVMIDTMLGDNDKAPFRIPNVGAVTTEKRFDGAQIPEYYQTFDSIDNPTVVSYGTFDKTSSNKADYVQFLKWYYSSETLFEIDIQEGREIGDSSVESVWLPKTIAPGETRVYKMYYGLGKFVADTTGALQLAGYAPNTATANDEGTGYNTEVVTAYLKNNSSADLKNVKLKLNLADGMSVVNGSNEINIGTFDGGTEKQLSFTVNFAPSSVEKTVSYSLIASADNADSKNVGLTTLLPALDIVEETTAEVTTVPEITVPETTVAPSTVPNATSATEKATAPATVDQATPDSAAVQTGSVSFAVIALLITMTAAGVMLFVRRKTN